MASYDEVTHHLMLADLAQKHAVQAQKTLIQHASRGDWYMAEQLRLEVVCLIEAALDAYIAAARKAHARSS